MAIMTIPHNPTYQGLLPLKVNIPFLLLHGGADAVVAYEDSERLYQLPTPPTSSG